MENSWDQCVRLEKWQAALVHIGLRISKSKFEYMHSNFSENTSGGDDQITIGGQLIPHTNRFKYS